MWNVPTKDELAHIPKLYASEKMSAEDTMIHMHFFFGSADWYVAEFDGEDIFFGYANLGDPMCAEWAYFSFTELKEIKVNGFEIDRNLYWQPEKFSEIKIVWSNKINITEDTK